jgi:nuclease-like protein
MSAPLCPICSSPTRRLTAKKGPKAGRDFWACSRYFVDGCTGKVDIEADEELHPPLPGASAQARFERERRIHRAQVRAALPVLTALLLVALAMTFFASVAISPILTIVGVTLVGGIGAYTILQLPADALYWDKGARGERMTGESLSALEEDGFVLLHDRQLPGSRANIDHIAIGPSGVYVIDSKNLSGSVGVMNERLFISDHDRQSYIESIHRQAIATQVALSEAMNKFRLTVTPVLCIHGARMPIFQKAIAGVRLLSGQDLRRIADKTPILLTADQVQELAHLAEERLRPMYSWD